VQNTHTHGRYVGSVSHGLVVGLLKFRAYRLTHGFSCVVCAGKPVLIEVDAPPE
jgi:hypothetical protein